jgi:hypothetical protein
LKKIMLELPGGSWQRPVQGDNQRFIPTFGTLTRSNRPPGFDQLQDLVRDTIKEDSTEDEKDQARMAYAAAARRLICPAAAIVPRLSPCVETAVQFMVDQGERLPAWRKTQFGILREIAEDLRPLSNEIRANGPQRLDWVPGENPAFVAAMIDAIDLPNKEFVKNMYISGFETTGVAQPRRLWRTKTPKEIEQSRPTMNIQQLLDSSVEFTTNLIRSMEAQHSQAVKHGDADALELCADTWAATMKEVNEKKCASGPFTRRQMDSKFGAYGWRPSPRFGRRQNGKVRCIDDGKRSLLNKAYQNTETVALMEPRFTAAVGQRIHEMCHERGIQCPAVGASVNDEPNAFRNIPVAREGLSVAAVISPKSGKVFFFPIRGHMFGGSPALPNYCEKSCVMSICAAVFTAAPVEPYVDDLTTVETELSRGAQVAGAT